MIHWMQSACRFKISSRQHFQIDLFAYMMWNRLIQLLHLSLDASLLSDWDKSVVDSFLGLQPTA